MFETITDLQITGVIRGNSTTQANINKRPSHMFIYKINGESFYYLRGKQVSLAEGCVLYVPEGESYSFQKVSQGDSLYCLVNFHCPSLSTEKPHLFFVHTSEHLDYVFKQMEKCWHGARNPSNFYELHSLFYHLVSLLLQQQDKPYYTKEQRERIAPAINYLDEHMYSHHLTISSLAKICNLSNVTFRNLFLAHFGENPKKYIIRCRMMKAKTIIESGEYNSISEVAYMVGYDDPLYFSRHFKNYFGCSPSEKSM